MFVALPIASKEEREEEKVGLIGSCRLFENTVRNRAKQVTSDPRSIVKMVEVGNGSLKPKMLWHISDQTQGR